MGYSPWDRKESDKTERLTHTHTHTHSRKSLIRRSDAEGTANHVQPERNGDKNPFFHRRNQVLNFP